ncbi:1-deoxy-D-xylulose-5-phosphate reductoisomerase [Oceanobacter antarcticus]|uniref:1-deoxy-D-xylulose 5-phosphate reductoisomerase n=1 Tax=Oceanobacter antarcticus TaxID=3133425 RepID=A0ABW8NDS3_9GAMM
MTRAVTILGATGSIGCSTLDVIARHPERYRVFALTAATNAEKLAVQVLEHAPDYAVMLNNSGADAVRCRLPAGHPTQVLSGEEALAWVAGHEDTDIVMAAIVGAAGLLPSLAAARAGKRVLLANKEALVMAGPLFMEAIKQGGAELLPIDSEHNAIFQSLPEHYGGHFAPYGISKILLTASGGPFRGWQSAQLEAVTPAQAVAHPNWSMGQKISVDSATLMNKGLELIEACFLFNCQPDQVQVVVHPQSVIHSLVQYCDGSVMAQLGQPDMRTPIAYGLAWPERITSGVAPLDLVTIGRFDFEAADEETFPCLALARRAFSVGGTMPTVLNAANEIAVEAFLGERIPFSTIPTLVKRVMDAHETTTVKSLETVLMADHWARNQAILLLQGSVNEVDA